MVINLSGHTINRYLVIALSLSLFVLAIWLSDTRRFFVQLLDVPVKIVLLLLTLQIFNLFVVSFRFWRVLNHFGIALPWQVASRASVSGHIAGLFMISLFGQVMGRNAVLRKCGVEPVVISGIAAYERMILAIISGLFCVFGLLWLFGQQYLLEAFDNKIAIQIVIAAVLSCLLSFCLGGSKFEKGIFKQSLSWVNGWRLIETVGVTTFGLLLTLTCFVAAGSAISGISAGWVDLFAAAAIISFAATIPITVNGWGVREVAAIFVLDKLGFSTTDAVLVSIIVGVCSMLVILGAIPFTIKPLPKFKEAKNTLTQLAIRSQTIDIAKMAGWFFGMATAVAVFFQVHIELSGGAFNLNLADPFAILALAAVLQYTISTKSFPQWRYSAFNASLAIITLLLIFGFVRGWMEIGVTQWALGGRLMGWLVLLGYLSAGYLTVFYAGMHGLRRFSETIVSAAGTVVIVQMSARFFDAGIGYNFEGYAGNRNAFAFQLLIATALILGYSKVYVQSRSRVLCYSALLGVILCGLVWSGSRAGLGVAGILIIGALWMHQADLKTVLMGVFAAVVVWCIVFGVQGVQGVQGVYARSSGSIDNSDNERWATFVHGWNLWLDSPLFGAGLGVFYEKSPAWIGRPQVIHNTMLWILAELGLVGALLVLGVFIGLFRFVWQKRKLYFHWILLMLLMLFAIISQAHEFFYQRIFWLVLGALLAKPLSRQYEHAKKT
ncbi:MAG TPA: hypothetical protein DCZ48_15930 [Methylococcaceae bacterium]|nr:hypothetical protein [Methylococcaceae bacterium]